MISEADPAKRTWPALFGIAAICFLLDSPALAESRFVQPSDDHREIFANAEPGDEFVLADGVWKDTLLKFHAEGTPESPITLKAQTPGKVIFTGKSGLAFSGKHLVVSGLYFRNPLDLDHIIQFRTDSRSLAEHCRLTNCAITNDREPNKRMEQKWVSIYGKHNRVDHSHFAGKQTDGPLLVVWVAEGDNHHRIDHNDFGPRKPLGRNGGETIRIGTSNVSMTASHTVVEDNFFEKCNGEAEIISNKSCNNIYRRNTFRECAGALTLRHGNDCRVEQNFFLGNKARGAGGVRIIGTGHIVINNYFADLEGDDGRSAVSFMNGLVDSPLAGYFQVEDATVAFNTFIDCKVGMTIGVGSGKKQPLVPKDCRVLNNLYAGRRNEIRELAKPENLKDAGNLRVDSIAKVKFQKDATGIWRPTAESPTRGQADLEYKLAEDIDSQKRTPPFDVGCDQFGSETRPPISRDDVGTDWTVPLER